MLKTLAAATALAAITFIPAAASATEYKVTCFDGAVVELAPHRNEDGKPLLAFDMNVVGISCQNTPSRKTKYTIRGLEPVQFSSPKEAKDFLARAISVATR